MFRRAAACLLTLIVAGAAAPARAQGPASCTIPGKNVYVRNVMSDIYLWYAMMPNVNPTAYDSPEAFLEAVRYKTLDSHFSYITSRAANDAFYSDSQFIGFGLSTSLNGSEMRVLQVFPTAQRSKPACPAAIGLSRLAAGPWSRWWPAAKSTPHSDRRTSASRRTSRSTRRAHAATRTW